jgi:thiol-disulfide isomerase/thioredoxin
VRRLAAFGLLACFASLASPSAALAADFDPGAWRTGAGAFVDALAADQEAERLLVVYFYTDWCGYCRQFEAELLGSAEVRAVLDGALAVRINPEDDEQGRRIADFYGVDGYPGFFVRGRASGAMLPLERMIREDGELRLMTPLEFVAALQATAER